jgi:cell division protein FtsQ
LSHLSVDSSTRLSDGVLARAAGVKRGDHRIALDMRAAEKRRSDDPWVRSVRMTRKLPSTLEIQLEENEAAALASLDGDIFLVGVDGVPFKAWEEGDPHDLPMLTGVTGDAIARDRAGAVERLAAGLAVIAHYARLPVSRVQAAQEVHLSPDGAVILTVGVHGVALHLGENPGPRKLLMVAEVLDMFTKKRRLPGVVFLDNHLHPERVVVRMR